jgi:hypothetical protein
MNDLEDRVRSSLQGMADRLAARVDVPPNVLRGARVRMARTAILGAVTAALVAVGSFAGVAALTRHGVTTRRPGNGSSQQASSFLTQMADLQDQAAEPTPIQPGQYVYKKSIHAEGPDGVTTTREDWIGTDGSGRILEGSSDETYPPAAPAPTCSPTCSTAEPGGGLFFVNPADFPTDTDSLRTLVEDRQFEGGPPGDPETYVLLADLLRETQTSPHLRAAIYRVIAALPGLEYVDDVADGTGRPGIAIGLTSYGERHELIIDANTGDLLGERYVKVDPGPFGATPAPGEGVNADRVDDPGTVNYWVAYLSSGIVDSTDSRP